MIIIIEVFDIMKEIERDRKRFFFIRRPLTKEKGEKAKKRAKKNKPEKTYDG